MTTTANTLRTVLRATYGFTNVSAADLLEWACDWQESWASNDSCPDSDQIAADVALARLALDVPVTDDHGQRGVVYLPADQFEAARRVLEATIEELADNIYSYDDVDPESDPALALAVSLVEQGSSRGLLFEWPEAAFA